LHEPAGRPFIRRRLRCDHSLGERDLIEDPRGEIDYEEVGLGPTILCAPGSWATRSAWRRISEALSCRFRIVTTSLVGYGRTAERRTAAEFSIEREAEIIEAVWRRAGGRVHLVGHSYGSQACLAVATRRAVPIASLLSRPV
jgi:pimeloyl-ACP methyl ester carboxylesterase